MISMVSTRRGDHVHTSWFCSKCESTCKELHEKPECHRCSDWNGCGGDCTLSRVVCLKCGDSKTFN